MLQGWFSAGLAFGHGAFGVIVPGQGVDFVGVAIGCAGFAAGAQLFEFQAQLHPAAFFRLVQDGRIEGRAANKKLLLSLIHL